MGEPTRDWFPISFMSTFSDWADLVHGPEPRVGPALLRMPSQLRHRHGADDRQGNQGSRAGHRVPERRQVAKDMAKVNDAARGKWISVLGAGAGAAAQLRSLPVAHALQDHRPAEEVRQDLRRHRQELRQGDRATAPWKTSKKRRADRWNFLFIAGMWFQDLFNYDFRRTEQCIIPYATQEGEISFCAYNTGVGWRNIIEKMHMTATLTKWYEEHGRHEIFAGGKKVGMRPGQVHAGAEPGARERRGQRHASTRGHRQERARGEDPRPRRQDEAGRRERAHGQALSRAVLLARTGQYSSVIH
jgi:7,8-dihydro-6-hydroxymethylpterin dimethyltransferase